ncbi:MAG: Gfo/Idh/MocA family oxidoreductase, partial [Bacteroidales bacterium]|nr:Gfo/Idh/MocA family oxidoreductase [Bacteroidales bacterium]
MKDKIRTGLASYGMSGRVFHAPFLETNPGYILKTVLERTLKRSKEKYPGVNIVTSYEELLSDKNIDLIVVNTPDHTHYELARKALNAGKHVVVEKPFVVESSDGEELNKIAEEENLVLSVFQNRRWDGDFITVKKVIKDGLLGRLVEYEAHFDRYRNFIKENTWKEEKGKGTGVLYNLGSHLIDQALVLFGLPELVNANIRAFRDGGKVNDYFDIRLEYANFRVILKSSYLVREPGP